MNRRQFVQSLVVAAGVPLDHVGIARGGTLGQDPARHEPPLLWYRRAASRWVEALPVGNGRLGAMVYGGVGQEHLQINDDTLWSGGPAMWHRTDAREAVAQVRRLTLEGRYAEADERSKNLMGAFTQSYLPLGDVWLTFEHGNVGHEYRRELNLQDAVAAVRYRIGNVRYTREVIASHPAGVTVVRLSADRPGMLTFEAHLSSMLRHTVTTEDERLRLRGEAPAHIEPSYWDSPAPVRYGHDGGTPGGQWAPGEAPAPGKGRRSLPGMRFELGLAAHAENGQVSVSPGGLRVQGADAVTLLIATATAFNGFDKDPALAGRDPGPLVVRQIESAVRTPWARLKDEHVHDHRALFDRFVFSLDGDRHDDLPTHQRVARHGARDAGLVELLFQYGRYLLIGSSRPGTQPANLQGIWNEDVRAPWSANYTININTEMNYWPAETAALPELHEPLLAFIGELAVNGKRTALETYGARRGWVAHHNSDVWRHSGMVGDWGAGDPLWACWQMGGAWLALHLYEHYLFGGDLGYLRARAYPVLRGAAEFCLDWLVEDGHGHLVTAPSTSPENRFRMPSGAEAKISPGATMDLAIIRDLFASTEDAAEVLGIDGELRKQLRETRARLRPYRIGTKGQLLEWLEEFEEPEPEHRHISHLFGLHPGRHITPATPQLFAAVRRSHELRGDGGTGWSLAWKINQWARLLDGDHAYKMLGTLLTLIDPSETNYGERGGVYANLFDAHPPFQIDGNFGATAGIVEMIAQSHGGEIHLLPALPSAWTRGRARGIRLRGGFDVDVEWTDGAVVRAELRSRLGGVARLRTPNVLRVGGASARPADGGNPNPFYRVHDPGRPIVSPGAPPHEGPRLEGPVIDIPTELNGRITLTGERR